MKIQNDEIIIEPTDISGLSAGAKSALSSATKQLQLFLRIPPGLHEPAEYLTAVLKQVLDAARRNEAASDLRALSKALVTADPTKRSQAESLIDQAKAVLGA